MAAWQLLYGKRPRHWAGSKFFLFLFFSKIHVDLNKKKKKKKKKKKTKKTKKTKNKEEKKEKKGILIKGSEGNSCN